MKAYDYVIIGGGMTAASAALAIREVDKNGVIAMISADGHPPYSRPPLSKKLWHGKAEEIIWFKLPEDRFDLVLNTSITALDPQQKQVVDSAGNRYSYQKLLLATGGTPREIPGAPKEIVYYRTIDDYHMTRSWVGKGSKIALIGGGFIGSEIAASLTDNGEKVSMVYLEHSLGERVYPQDLSKFVTDYFQQKGVEVHPNIDIQGVEKQGSTLVMHSKDGQSFTADHIIAGLGIIPNTAIAQAAGISIAGPEGGRGIAVDEHLRTNFPEIFAAGDVASFYNSALQRQMRVEHEDNALTMGRTAGLNMAGQATAYAHQPYFYSDLFDLGYEAVGELDSRMDIFEDWVEPFRKGVVYYMKDQKVRGVLLWNTWDRVESARALIAEDQPHSPSDLKGRLH
jgi:3-phenylpropionate/trans-cinnamate dioxygenase ferredoxin reductase subunit